MLIVNLPVGTARTEREVKVVSCIKNSLIFLFVCFVCFGIFIYLFIYRGHNISTGSEVQRLRSLRRPQWHSFRPRSALDVVQPQLLGEDSERVYVPNMSADK